MRLSKENRNPDWLKPDEVAPLLSVSRNLVYKLIREGELQIITIGRNIFVTKEEVKRFIKASTQ